MNNESSIEMLDRIIELHKMQVKILELKIERLQSDLARCKSERLGNIQSELYQNNILRSYPEEMHSYRKSQDGKG